MVKKVILLLASAVLSTQAIAACDPEKCVDAIPEKLYIAPNGDVNIGTPLDHSYLTCTTNEDAYLVLKKSSANFDEAYSLILAAHLGNSPLTIRTDTSITSYCKVVYVVSGDQ